MTKIYTMRFLLAVSLLVTAPYVLSNELEGCWTPKEYVTVAPTKEARVIPVANCATYISADKIVTGCKGRNHRERLLYQISAPGRIRTLRFYPGKWPEESDRYSLDGETLEFVITSLRGTPHESTEVRKHVRNGHANSESECLPEKIVVSAEEFAQIFRIPELVASHLNNSAIPFLAAVLTKESVRTLPDNLPPPDQIQRFRDEYAKIVDEFSSPIVRLAKDDPKKINELFFRNFKYDPEGYEFLARPEGKAWAAETSHEFIELGKVAPYAGLAFPLLIKSMKRPLPGKDQVNGNYGVGKAYQLQREMLLAGILEDIPGGFLPLDRSELATLRETSAKNIELATKRHWYAITAIEEALGKTAYELLKQESEKTSVNPEHVFDQKMKGLLKRYAAIFSQP